MTTQLSLSDAPAAVNATTDAFCAQCGASISGKRTYCSDRCRLLAWARRQTTPTPQEATQLALLRVERHADRAWLDAAYAALLRCARAMESFISDDVWIFGLERTREDRALGPVFLRAKRAGVIEKTDRVRPSVRSHLSGKPVWLSRIFGRAA